jgi:hypothetical protein
MAMQASDVVEREIHGALAMHPAAATGDDVELQVLLAGRASVSRMRTRTRDTRIIYLDLTGALCHLKLRTRAAKHDPCYLGYLSDR